MADVRVIERDRRDLLGEGPLWSAREGALSWTDILAGRLNRLDPATGVVTSREFGGYLGWAIEREGGGLVAGLDRRIVTIDGDAATTLADLPGEPEGNRVNDAKADALGRVWFGTMPVSCEGATGAFYRLDAGGAGCVTRFTPEGARERSIALPASQITCCTFAGEALDRMYVTSASVDCADPLGGSLFEVDPGCRGVPACRFAG